MPGTALDILLRPRSVAVIGATDLVEAGIDSVSVTPDSFLAVKNNVVAAERGLRSGNPRVSRRPRRS